MPRVACLIEDARWRACGDPRRLARAAARAAATQAPGVGGEVTVLFSNDAALRGLNARWRGKDKPTNVLSFPGPAGSGVLGDIVLAFETIRDEADVQGKSLADHLSHLVVHGMLHLLGHDHESLVEAERMEALEVTVLAGLGIADPYAASASLESAPA